MTSVTISTKSKNVTLAPPAVPITALNATLSASNAAAATPGTTAPGTGTDAPAIMLYSDAAFATGRTLALTNGAMIYRQGLITAVKADTDPLRYTITDTVTGAVITKTQTVALGIAMLTTLTSFNGANGSSPSAGLIADAAGDLFGTTWGGGPHENGTVFEIAKTSAGYAGTLTALVSLNGINGSFPMAGLMADAAGNLFGTAEIGGPNNAGTVFEIAKTSTGYANTPTTLVSFNETNGSTPFASLIADAAGDLFGTTLYGGANSAGTVFEIKKTSTGYASTPTTLVSFNTTLSIFGVLVGGHPLAGLIADATGDLFGTTEEGGANYAGTVFEVAKTSTGYASMPIILVSFDGANGSSPSASLIADAAGDLVGTTELGGPNNAGTVFEIAKTSTGYASTPITLVSFNGADGSSPSAGLIADAAGDLFGTTETGGAYHDGTVFKIAKTSAGYASTPITLVSFNGANGSSPSASLIADAAGDLFGTTEFGGASGYGATFELTNSGFVVSVSISPVVTLVPIASASNAVTATLGTAAPGMGTDALKVTLTSDAYFATSSMLTLINGTLVYTPGLITAAKAGADTIKYTVIDTVTGAVTTEIQNVMLATPAVPIVTLNATPSASNAATAILGTAAPGTGTDALSVTLISDAVFITGSTLTLTNDTLIYTPGQITAAIVGSDTIKYTITDTVTGTATSETQTIALGNPTLTTLVSFTNASQPHATLIADAAGNLFGTTEAGSPNGSGTVFEIAKTSTGYASTPTTLVAGSGSTASLIVDSAGDLFGTTYQGGANGTGTVFEIAKTSTGYASTPITLVSFNGAGRPLGGLVADAAGNLFGSTNVGGTNSQGSVFEITKTGIGYASTLTTLVNFNGSNGYYVQDSLIADAIGNLFGTTDYGGVNNDGTVFEIAKTSTGYASTPITLVSFSVSNGFLPTGRLTADAFGNLFGTTSGGGKYYGGTVFEIVKTSTGYASTPVTLVNFYQSTGSEPVAGLITDSAGNLFGTTFLGGANNHGTAFEIPKTSTGYANMQTTLVNFYGSNGSSPAAGLIADPGGDLFGAAALGGANNAGTVFELTNTGFVVPTGQTYTLNSTPVSIVAGVGNDVYNATAGALNSRDSLDGGGGNNTLNLVGGGGVFDLGAPKLLANIQTVHATEGSAPTTIYMRDGYSTTVDLAPAPSGSGTAIIYGGTGNDVFNLATGTDTVVLGSAGEGVYADGGTALVQAAIAFAGAVVVGGTTGTTTLELTSGGTASLAAADSHVIVKLDATTQLSLSTATFITAIGSTGMDTIAAGGAGQTLTGGSGADTLIGFVGFGDIFRDTFSGISGDTIVNFGGSDLIDVTDLTFGLLKALKLSVAGSGTSVVSTLTATDGTHTAGMTLLGAYTLNNFVATSDGHTGTQFGVVHS